jgi:hypothetical protein
MNRLASPPSPAPSAPSALDDVLAAPLQSALNSLNVQLEHELARYRLARQGQAMPQKPVFKPRQRPLNLISVGARPVAGSSAANAPAGQAVPPPPPNPRLQRSASAAGPQAIPPSTWAGGAIVPQADIVPQTAAAPSDYMASSEALLESLGNESPQPSPATYGPPTASWTQALATPLGMGALLLLLVVSGGLGYVLVNPAAVSHLAALWPFGQEAEPVTQDPGTVAVDSPSDRSGPALSPDLSEQEFVRLDLSTLSTLPLSAIRPPRAASTPTTAVDSTPTTTAITPDSGGSDDATTEAATAAPAPSRASANRPAPAATTPAPRPAPATTTPAAPRQPTASRPAAAPAAPAPTPAPVATSTYYVVTDYTGDPSLNQARQAVGDAYVRNFPVGARIQLGAFSSEADAAAHVEALQGQGINAQVYNP